MLTNKACSSRRQVRILLSMATCATLTYVLLRRWQMDQIMSASNGWTRHLSRSTGVEQQVNREEEDYIHLQALVRYGLLDFTQVSKVRLANPWLTDMDKDILRDSALDDVTTVASPHTSQLHVILPTPPRSLAGTGPAPTAPEPSLVVMDHVTVGSGLSLAVTNHVTVASEPPFVVTDHVHAASEPPLVVTDHVYTASEPPLVVTDHVYTASEPPLVVTDHVYTASEPPLVVTDHVYTASEPPLVVMDNAHVASGLPLVVKNYDKMPSPNRTSERSLASNDNETSLPGSFQTEVDILKLSRSSSLVDKYHASSPPGRSLAVGDHVTVRVDLKDEAGRAVLKGGAEVRIWAVRAMNVSDDSHWFAVAGHVTDLRNGSYVASLPVLWSGNLLVQAALVRPREFRRLILRLMDTVKMMDQVVAKFISGQGSEVTLCSFIPVIPGFSDVCNLTAANGGLPWYCGRPSKQTLSCDDWKLSSNTDFPLCYPGLSPAEVKLMSRFMEEDRALFHLKETVAVKTVLKDNHPPIRNKICHNTSPRDTWTGQSPRGFWDNDQWRPLDCDLPPLTASLLSRCLNNTTVLLLGDSNARQILEAMNSTAQCQENDGDLGLHDPVHVHCPGDLRLTWIPHAYPFYSGGSHAWTDTRAKHAPSFSLDRLPSTGNYVILIHLYMHFSPAHTSVYALHVRDTARAVRDLVTRNPQVKVFVRGPHAVGGNTFRLAGDYHAERCTRVLRHEFRHLRQHVFFLDVWDMTVANENYDVHPSHQTVRAVTTTMLSHLCSPDG